MFVLIIVCCVLSSCGSAISDAETCMESNDAIGAYDVLVSAEAGASESELSEIKVMKEEILGSCYGGTLCIKMENILGSENGTFTTEDGYTGTFELTTEQSGDVVMYRYDTYGIPTEAYPYNAYSAYIKQNLAAGEYVDRSWASPVDSFVGQEEGMVYKDSFGNLITYVEGTKGDLLTYFSVIIKLAEQ